ncbi:MAG: AraC family transcriptional regulator, partial [Bacteroidota bacterium]
HQLQLQKHFTRVGEGPGPDPSLLNHVDQAFIDRIITYIISHLNKPQLGAAELAQEMALSKTQLYRKIKAVSGQSTAIFIRNVRLDQARQLLKEDSLSITDVAYMTGFSDPNYFSRKFKERFGQSPRSLRKTGHA